MIDNQQLDLVDQAMLTPLVQKTLDSATAEITDWRWAPIDYDMYLPRRILARFSGHATLGEDVLPWSLVLKLSLPPDASGPRRGYAWKREALAYQSGLLDDLAGGLAAPRVMDLVERKDGATWLWLEDVTDAYEVRWPLSQFTLAAYHLGQFNGAYLTGRPLPTFPWLVYDWPSLHSEPHKIPPALAQVEMLATDSRVLEAFSDYEAGKLTGLLEDQPLFRLALVRLPHTLCHHDASQANLFARSLPGGGMQTVAIDWESIGSGAVGAEIATLVFGTIRRGLFSAQQVAELDRAVFSGYLKGLVEAGWSGDPELVRLGYSGTIALRWFLLHGTLRTITDENVPAARGTLSEETRERAIEQFILLSKYLLDCAEEARMLGKRHSYIR